MQRMARFSVLARSTSIVCDSRSINEENYVLKKTDIDSVKTCGQITKFATRGQFLREKAVFGKCHVWSHAVFINSMILLSRRQHADGDTSESEDEGQERYERFVNQIRERILEHGYRAALSAWVRSTPFRQMSEENQNNSFRFFLWTRNLFIVFERHGEGESRNVLSLMDPDLLMPGHWNQASAFDEWFNHRNATEEGRATLRGWVHLTRAELDAGRAARARAHSLDGVSDVLYERTESDAEFVAVLGDVKYADAKAKQSTAGGSNEEPSGSSAPVTPAAARPHTIDGSNDGVTTATVELGPRASKAADSVQETLKE
jgi:hypothetical protein